MSINLRTSLEVPGNLDAPGVETCEILEGRRGEVDAARGATGAEVDDGGVDELALVCNEIVVRLNGVSGRREVSGTYSARQCGASSSNRLRTGPR